MFFNQKTVHYMVAMGQVAEVAISLPEFCDLLQRLGWKTI